MKILNKFFVTSLALILFAAFFHNTTSAEMKKEVQILFTHDMHSHLDAFQKLDNGTSKSIGGFARLKTFADQKRATVPATILVDGGDFSMGTLYQTIYETEAPELVLMGQIGYDATTFGNHEFDYRSQGIANMLHSALRYADEHPECKLPALVNANIDWEKNTSEDNQQIHEAMDAYKSKPYIILERGGVRFGIFGLLGKDADDCAPESGLQFDDIVESSKQVVKELQKEQADMIVCLSHSGTFEDKDKSEDEILAKEVPEIDVIVSGHTHTTLDAPICYEDTYIVSSGCYGENLGEIHFTQKENGRWKLDSYLLNPLDDSISENASIKTQLTQYKDIINKTYLSRFGYTFDQVLAENPISFTQMDSFGLELREDPLGSLIADSYIYAIQQAEGEHYQRVYAAFVPAGIVRETFQKGLITVSDAFTVSSLGIGADRIPGYPLVSVYLTGEELKTIAEIDVSISTLMPTAQLYPSRMRWTYNPNRLLLNRVTDVEFVTNVPFTSKKETEELDDHQLYRITAGLYSAQMLGTIEDTSKGLLKICPKDKAGNPITNFEEHIVCDSNGTEVKEWYALASYLESFEPNQHGISQVPSYYEAPEGRKNKIDSHNIYELVKQPNKFAWICYGGIFVLFLLITGGGIMFYKKKKRKKISKNICNKR